MAAERGQAGVELVVVLPCLVLLVAALAQACLFALCTIAAERAASAGARAVARGASPGPAVRSVLPAALARSVSVRVGADGAVAVTLVVPRLLPVPTLTVGAAER
jgi:Flp pilus assembly protein TadG